MKTTYLLWKLTLLLVFTSCTKDEDHKIELKNTLFIHEIEDCTFDPLLEMNCTEWIEFGSNSSANVLIGGGDIVYTFNYTIEDDNIKLRTEEGFGMELIFAIINDSTLQLISRDDNPVNTVWVRD